MLANMPSSFNRRRFLWTTGVAGIGLSSIARAQSSPPAVSPNSKLRVLSIGVLGTIGKEDRLQVSRHPSVEISGLCDVDSNALAIAAKDHPGAFTCRDYREAFTKYVDKFDAVIVSTPDHSHAPIMLTAMAHHKHVYGQKPLVHQLEELEMMTVANAARPNLVTQVGNQRMAFAGRRAAVEILRSGALGKAIEAHAWVNSPNDRDYFNLDRAIGEPVPPPNNLDWNLWLCACEDTPYRDGIAPIVWRSWWNYGSNGLGDWGLHVLDVLFNAYDDLKSPIAVQTNCLSAPNPLFHAHPCHSTITYNVDSAKFARKQFVIHYSDSAQAPSRASLGLPEGNYPDKNMTLVVCEGGVLCLTANARLEIWRDGKVTSGLKMPGLPEFPPMNHWHAWVDNCIGIKTELRSPFKDALRMTEATQLAVKATHFPNQELRWDRPTLTFTNNEEATNTIVRRTYREGFAPPDVA
ncbi:MAG: Gfo/Idh/MocA family oxidoreductase [Gloeobacteraceae cyanobacterium ES-bin-144]|nr:Gfo/Idh/MocA family oxidoreductase [Verrucomicrobiales bacterium]